MNLSKKIGAYRHRSKSTEDYRILKNNIQLLSVDNNVQIIMVASSGAREGRSIIASNLAKTLADSEKKTILLDCDNRNPNIHKIFRIPNEKGLTNILMGEVKFEETNYETKQKNLYVITLGDKTLNYAELLSTSRLNAFLQKLKESFDYIIIDTPPVTLIDDAQVISKYTDACIFVVAAHKIDRKSVVLGKESLEKAGANIIGVVFNRTHNKRFGIKRDKEKVR